MLATLTVGQGEAVLLSLPDESGLASVAVTWEGAERQLHRQSAENGDDGVAWRAWLGIDLDASPGRFELPLTLNFVNGATDLRRWTLVVEARTYPTTRLSVESAYVDLAPADQSRAATEATEIASIYATVSGQQLWFGNFRVPVDGARDGRNFGHRRIFNGQARSPHSGTDLRAAEGTPIRAANTGRVVLAKPLFFSGNTVFLDHGLGVYSVYLHLSEFRVAVGDTVGKGDLLGFAGATGRVTGAHLHWGVRIYGARVDPFSLVQPTG